MLTCVCVFWLSVKVDQGLPCVHHHKPRLSGKPLQGTLLAQTLIVLWRHLLDNRKASVLNLVLRDDMME